MANFNFNKAIIGGRLVSDPELKQTPSGLSVTTFTVAINRKGTDDKTDFIDVVAWRQTAEFICKFFRKGSNICIVGSIQKREWKDKDGNKRYATEVIAEEATFVDSKGESEEASFAVEKSNRKTEAEPKFEEVADIDGDLPF